MGQSSPEAKKAWLARNPHRRQEINRNWKLRNVYGITPEMFDNMYYEQGGKCAICLRDLRLNEKGYNELHIDHDHETMYVRGLLCSRCNLAIGQFEDSITYLQSAVLYLQNTKTPEDFVFNKVPNTARNTNSSSVRTPEWRKRMSEAAKNRYRKDLPCLTQM